MTSLRSNSSPEGKVEKLQEVSERVGNCHDANLFMPELCNGREDTARTNQDSR
jgi:hypothetical protein